MRTNRSSIGVVLLVAGALALLGGCGGSSDDGDGDGTTTTTVDQAASTSVPGPTVTSETPATDPSATTESTPSNGSVPPTTVPLLVPGQPCAPGSDPDCIDPYADGQFVYLIGGADCMASPIGGSMCADLDGDGRAGYPDSG
jgi:hypothetical protein